MSVQSTDHFKHLARSSLRVFGSLDFSSVGRWWLPNQALHATATVLCDFARARKHSTVVAVASALPVAVRELER